MLCVGHFSLHVIILPVIKAHNKNPTLRARLVFTKRRICDTLRISDDADPTSKRHETIISHSNQKNNLEVNLSVSMVVNLSELVTVTKSVRYEAVRPDGRLRPSPCRWPAVRGQLRVPPVVLQACTWGAAAVVSSSSPSARREAAPLPASSSWRNGGLPPSSGRDRTRGLLPRPGNQPPNLNYKLENKPKL